MNHIRTLLELDEAVGPVEEEVIKLSLSSIKGLEVDEEIAGLANASLKARLGTRNESLVAKCDSLNPSALKLNGSRVKLGTHLCAASNPPFGTKITVKDPEILRNFDLSITQSRRNPSLLDGVGRMTPRAPDILFLEQNIHVLEPGRGRLAIVMPYQTLSGPQTLFVREWLLRQAEVLAVIDLPMETFQPHTGTKTTLLVVKRRAEPLSNPQEKTQGTVFMAMPRWIGQKGASGIQKTCRRFVIRGNPVRLRRSKDSIQDLPGWGQSGGCLRALFHGAVFLHCARRPLADERAVSPASNRRLRRHRRGLVP